MLNREKVNAHHTRPTPTEQDFVATHAGLLGTKEAWSYTHLNQLAVLIFDRSNRMSADFSSNVLRELAQVVENRSPRERAYLYNRLWLINLKLSSLLLGRQRLMSTATKEENQLLVHFDPVIEEQVPLVTQPVPEVHIIQGTFKRPATGDQGNEQTA